MSIRAVPSLVAFAAALLLSACATGPEQPAESPAPAPGTRPAPGPEPARTAPVVPGDAARPAPSPGAQPAAPGAAPQAAGVPAERSVYFDFDRFDVKDEYRSAIEANARYLSANPGARAAIQGNADERGSREYNVGLGQRRAEAVARMLMLLGARDTQLEAVSFGEEKPVCTENNEACWQRNRHADIVYGGR